MIKQRTIKNSIRATGVGLHTGEKVYLTLHAAEPDSGIVFRRTDLAPMVSIMATPENVGDTNLHTTLVSGDTRISTIEHLMSALAGLGVDNLIVDVSAEEIPIMDGSAGPFVFLLQSAGILEQDAAKKFIRIKKPITVTQDDKVATFRPFDGFKVNFSIDFDHPVLRRQTRNATIDFSSTSFVKEVSRARTFGFVKDIEYLQSIGLARGASLDNAVGIDDDDIVNEQGLRYSDEFVKHKILDAIGDLYVVGNSLIGEYDAHKSGHGLNNESLRALMADKDAWEIVTFENNPEDMPISFAYAS
ncbi:MAG TPA: UDP-3-O-[3-hydroxymyristoyl] N-acetylglucosamine deacetylase [Porticoccaceae bacterium]|jgi:UDP-3-O-[3-hydroxymyristoyl] N-acetylglucosamine deacetylase|nr:UDP-3-O-[3-hydroxymyristoyl] N-acetylglucosamine deacetylase [Porticoccaceae bacterium]